MLIEIFRYLNKVVWIKIKTRIYLSSINQILDPKVNLVKNRKKIIKKIQMIREENQHQICINLVLV